MTATVLLPLLLAAGALELDASGWMQETFEALAAGNPQEALDKADTGLRHYPRYPGLLYGKGHALARLGRWKEAVRALEDAYAAGYANETVEAEILEARRRARQEQQEATTPPRDNQRTPSPWNLRVTPYPIGYDTNLVSANTDWPLAREIGRESTYSQINASLTRQGTPLLGLEASARHYWDEPRASFLELRATANYTWRLSERLSLAAGAGWLESFVQDAGRFRRGWWLSAGPQWAWSDRTHTLLDAGWLHTTWFASAPDPQDRDGDLSWLRLRQPVRVSPELVLTPWTTVKTSSTEGRDFDFDGLELGLQAIHDHFGPFALEASVSFTDLRYRHANSLSLSGRRRRDGVLSLSVTLTLRDVPLKPMLTATFVAAESNLEPFEYDRLDVSGGFAGIELPW